MQTQDPGQPDKRYQELAVKWKEGTQTPAEEKEFLDWYNRSQDAPVRIPASFAGSEEELQTRIWTKLQTRIAPAPVVASRPFLRAGVAAAAAFAAFTIGMYFWWQPGDHHKVPVQTVKVSKHDLQPSHHATLTLADGSEIALDAAGNGPLSQQGSTTIIKLSNGQVAYRFGARNRAGAAVSFNTISTPRGEQYQLILPDDSHVWLNAASSLRFPTAFTGGQRTVELSGEAYFEVAKNKKMPFVVRTGQMQVQVLGTHFNVMAYQEEKETKTTLLEGSVKLTRGPSQALLQPGEQGQLNGELFKVRKDVNLEEVMAWKNGAFYFHDTKLDAIMRQIERWYDVTVEYAGPVPEISLSGNISRAKDVRELLEILEATHQVKFNISGTRIRVIPEPGD